MLPCHIVRDLLPSYLEHLMLNNNSFSYYFNFKLKE